MKLNLIRTCAGEIVNLDNIFGIGFDAKANATIAYSYDVAAKLKVADGNALTLLWNGRRDFYEGGEC